ncbi:hypothetical protein KDI_04940 [Dictyobacter arantiisoli]|uniref:Lantibiotic biosynthesis protein dehydration domain-containing protein n=2 Tax=Dictyobacter arantiisoli TaxID=2014874 RepID=A0A5A5T655_9CHLR|nr:hypothetical protein KDI_04940 [Dictyobacter arantiisoli]
MKQLLPSNEQQAHYKALWYRALTLTERAILLPDTTQQPSVEPESVSDSVRQRFQSWKEQPPFKQGTLFTQRLAADALSEKDLFTLLSEPVEQLQGRLAETTSLPWLATLIDTFATRRADSDPTPLFARVKQQPPAGNLSFLDTIEPLMTAGLIRLEAGVQELAQIYTHLPFEPQKIVSLLSRHIPERVLPKLLKTLVLELNIARVQGRLQGKTSEARFHDFIQQLMLPQGMLPLLEEYVVLGRQLVETIDMWVNYELELLTRLCNDWQEICAQLNAGQDPGVLIEIRSEQGDTHRHGRSVAILTWSSGFQLVYKPRSLAIDVHFQKVLTWINQQGFQPAFQTIKILNQEQYGWVEFIRGRSCSSEEEVARFYERQGGYLALLYALEATDFHGENLIAAGEHPILIDLEALFHPPIGEQDQAAKNHPAMQAMDRSVMRTNLLPQRIWTNEQGQSIDISGLGGAAGQKTPMPVPRWAELGTDNMQIKLEQVEIQLGNHRPQLYGKEVDTLQYCPSIIKGFSAAYHLILKNRQILLNDVLPLFVNDEIRCLVRPTRFYTILLNNSYHPEILRDALERDRFFDRLWLDAAQEPLLTRVIASERADLWKGDVPLFTTTPTSHDLFTTHGDVIPDFFTTTGLEMATNHIKNFSEQDLERQIWFIQATFASVAPLTDKRVHRAVQLDPTSPLATQEHLLTAARKIGQRLNEQALRAGTTIEWLTMQQFSEYDWRIMPTDIDLYNGNTGIALFLAYLGHITHEQHYTAFAQDILAATREQFQNVLQHAERYRIGAFTGLSSYVYLLLQLGSLWQDQTLHQEAEALIPQLAALVEQDQLLDIVGGTAGFLAILTSFYTVLPSSTILTAAIQCGDHLLAQMQHTSEGSGWLSRPYKLPLTGFSQGNAGIAWSLCQLFEISGKARFRRSAFVAWEYERKLYSQEKQNWPDRRKVALSNHETELTGFEDEEYMTTWCHGAAGIALARLGSLATCDDEKIREEIENALQTTLTDGFSANHSLCHGDLGNLDILLTAQHLLGDEHYQTHIQHLSSMLLYSIEVQGWITGVPQGIETPGLMTGLAGIGYALLRLAAPDQVPSILLLEPPINTTQG